MRFEQQVTRFVVKAVIGAVLVTLLAIAAFASTRIVTGTGDGLAEYAAQDAIKAMQRKCPNGQLSNVQTVSVTPLFPDKELAGYVTIVMVGTCTE